jgi:thioredoxin-like negative regulator of GroEL
VEGGDHPGTLAARSNLASTYLQAGRPAEAVPLFERTLADSERVLGADHPITQAARRELTSARNPDL